MISAPSDAGGIPPGPPGDHAGESYDRVPYTSHAYAESHPDRLRVVARLSGWNPPPLAGARVLEVGSGRGGNVLAMAMSLPGASLVGIEPSARQAAETRTIAAHLGVPNVAVHTAGFGDRGLLADADGTFDFVLAHGVASWIAPGERAGLLRRIGRWLSPGGVGYVSFNVLPGWYARLAARDWLRFRSGDGPGAVTMGSEDAVASLRWLMGAVSPEMAGYREGLARVEARLLETDAAYLAHEYLEGENHPASVADLLEEAEEAGLAYLGDAIPSSVALETLPESARERSRGLGVRAAQQLVDFVRCTAFRRALFVRRDTCDARGWRWPGRLDPGAVRALRVASRLRPSGPGAPGTAGGPSQFDGADVSVQVTSPMVRAALLELSEVAPRALAFEDLVARVTRRIGASLETREADLASEILELWLGIDGIDLHDFEAPFEAGVAEGLDGRAKACPLARFQAARGEPITNRWHQEVVLSEVVVKDVLVRADGTRTVAELARALSAEEELVRASLLLLAKSALLVG